jgi:hypothetical protein
MQLTTPIVITPRLMAGARIGDGWLSIGYSDRPGDEGRARFIYHIDTPDFEHTGEDLQSGCGESSLQSGLASLCGFLSACGESYSYDMRHGEPGENYDLFPPAVAEWAYQRSGELSMLECELETTPDLISE